MKDESHGLEDISSQVFWLPAVEKASFLVSCISFFFITYASRLRNLLRMLAKNWQKRKGLRIFKPVTL